MVSEQLGSGTTVDVGNVGVVTLIVEVVYVKA